MTTALASMERRRTSTSGPLLPHPRHARRFGGNNSGQEGGVVFVASRAESASAACTVAWYRDSSGGFIPAAGDVWDPVTALLAFPKISSSPRVHRFVGIFRQIHHVSALSVPRQLREVQAALSVNKSELARILRVSRRTVYDWLDGTAPNAENTARIRLVGDLISEASVSVADPLFPRFVRFPVAHGHPALLDLLCEDPITETAVGEALGKARALGNAIDRERREREARLRVAGFETVDDESRDRNLASNVALMDWPRE